MTAKGERRTRGRTRPRDARKGKLVLRTSCSRCSAKVYYTVGSHAGGKKERVRETHTHTEELRTLCTHGRATGIGIKVRYACSGSTRATVTTQPKLPCQVSVSRLDALDPTHSASLTLLWLVFLSRYLGGDTTTCSLPYGALFSWTARLISVAAVGLSALCFEAKRDGPCHSADLTG